MAADGRSVDKADADIMEESGFLDKGEIERFAAGEAIRHRQRFGRDRPAVGKEDLPRRITGGVIFFQQRPGIQEFSSPVLKWRCVARRSAPSGSMPASRATATKAKRASPSASSLIPSYND